MPEEKPITEIYPNPNNPRRPFREESDFTGLVASIENQGIIQPLLINREGMILAGHRRYAAALELGLQSVPVRVLPQSVNQALVPLVENLQRSDLSILEIADYLFVCQQEHGLSLQHLADMVGISRGTIKNYIKLALAPKELRDRIDRDDITLGAAFAMLTHGDQFIREVINEPGLTRGAVRERAKRFTKTQAETERAKCLACVTRLEAEWQTLSQIPHMKSAAILLRKTIEVLYDLNESERTA